VRGWRGPDALQRRPHAGRTSRQRSWRRSVRPRVPSGLRRAVPGRLGRPRSHSPAARAERKIHRERPASRARRRLVEGGHRQRQVPAVGARHADGPGGRHRHGHRGRRRARAGRRVDAGAAAQGGKSPDLRSRGAVRAARRRRRRPRRHARTRQCARRRPSDTSPAARHTTRGDGCAARAVHAADSPSRTNVARGSDPYRQHVLLRHAAERRPR
jgi:hypothetical protein